MYRNPQPFLARMFSVVLGTLLFVMSVAFISIPISLGGHPGEAIVAAAQPAFHLT